MYWISSSHLTGDTLRYPKLPFQLLHFSLLVFFVFSFSFLYYFFTSRIVLDGSYYMPSYGQSVWSLHVLEKAAKSLGLLKIKRKDKYNGIVAAGNALNPRSTESKQQSSL